MEVLRASGQARRIGVSNVGIHHLREFFENPEARFKPEIVQNRCYASRGWDREVREYCLANGIIYQGFSLLTANPQVVMGPRIDAIAKRLNATPAQVVFRFAAQTGILPLTGTTDPQHMKEDLASLDLCLFEDEIRMIQG